MKKRLSYRKRQGWPDFDLIVGDLVRDRRLWKIAYGVQSCGWCEAEDFVQTFCMELIRALRYYDCKKKSSFEQFSRIILRNCIYDIKRKAKHRLPVVDIGEFDVVDRMRWDSEFSEDCNVYFALELLDFTKAVVRRYLEEV
jgi:DNA-directed RNA polymerase specialized sigma24 family protein